MVANATVTQTEVTVLYKNRLHVQETQTSVTEILLTDFIIMKVHLRDL